MGKQNGGAAFPRPGFTDARGEYVCGQFGMQGELAAQDCESGWADATALAAWCGDIADAMLAEDEAAASKANATHG